MQSWKQNETEAQKEAEAKPVHLDDSCSSSPTLVSSFKGPIHTGQALDGEVALAQESSVTLPASAPSGSGGPGDRYLRRIPPPRPATFRPRVERLLLLSALSPLLLPLGASPRAIPPSAQAAAAGNKLAAGRRGRARAREGEDGRPRACCVSAACRPCARVHGSGQRAGSGARGKVAPRALAGGRAGGRGWGRAGPP